jgi:hypothetical protein
VLQAHARDPLSVFLLAALPSKVEEWGGQAHELRDRRFWLEVYEMHKYRRFAPADPKRAPVENLEAVLATLMKEATENRTRWVRYTFSSPVRAPFKKTLAAFVAKQLPAVQLTPR